LSLADKEEIAALAAWAVRWLQQLTGHLESSTLHGVISDATTRPRTELVTPDVAGAKSFYSGVLGWEIDDQPMGEFTYTVMRPAGGDENSSQGGIMPLSPAMTTAGATTRWQPYFEVADCDVAAAAVTANGGTVVVPAADIPGVGRLAVALDPDGDQFAVIASVPA
jgi:predicted enzyme related to lactoylglutathione lyase